MAAKSLPDETTLVADTCAEMAEALTPKLVDGYEILREYRRPSGEFVTTLRRAALFKGA